MINRLQQIEKRAASGLTISSLPTIFYWRSFSSLFTIFPFFSCCQRYQFSPLLEKCSSRDVFQKMVQLIEWSSGAEMENMDWLWTVKNFTANHSKKEGQKQSVPVLKDLHLTRLDQFLFCQIAIEVLSFGWQVWNCIQEHFLFLAFRSLWYWPQLNALRRKRKMVRERFPFLLSHFFPILEKPFRNFDVWRAVKNCNFILLKMRGKFSTENLIAYTIDFLIRVLKNTDSDHTR